MSSKSSSSSSSLLCVLPRAATNRVGQRTTKVRDADPLPVVVLCDSGGDDGENDTAETMIRRPRTSAAGTSTAVTTAAATGAVAASRRTSSSTTSSCCCGVCRRNEARYACPKCELPYCSVGCYRRHNRNDDDNSSKDDGSQDGAGASSCTERFYRDRVEDALRLEVQERRDATLRMLNRAYRRQRRDEEEEEQEEEEEEGAQPLLSQEELYELLAALEKYDDDDRRRRRESDDEEEKIFDSVFGRPELRAAFERALRTGELEDWILEPWRPWWRPELVVKADDDGTADDDDEEEEEEEEENGRESNRVALQANSELLKTKTKHLKTLDERLLEVPSFDRIRPRKSKAAGDEDRQQQLEFLSSQQEMASARPPALPRLQYNLLDVLYGTAYALRLYHGVANAQQEVAVEAAQTLVGVSVVLSSSSSSYGKGGAAAASFDALEEVMTSCISREYSSSPTTLATATLATTKGGNVVSWDVLATDVALICQNRRMICRALFEASDILRAAAKRINSDNSGKGKSTDNRVREEEGAATTPTELRRVRKKIEFYLSWTKEPTSPVSSLSRELEGWIAHWKQIGSVGD